jgi:hypothetical protein
MFSQLFPERFKWLVIEGVKSELEAGLDSTVHLGVVSGVTLLSDIIIMGQICQIKGFSFFMSM